VQEGQGKEFAAEAGGAPDRRACVQFSRNAGDHGVQEVRAMAGVKGKITRARRGKQRSVYLSDLFGIWQEGGKLHFTFLKNQGPPHVRQ